MAIERLNLLLLEYPFLKLPKYLFKPLAIIFQGFTQAILLSGRQHKLSLYKIYLAAYKNRLALNLHSRQISLLELSSVLSYLFALQA